MGSIGIWQLLIVLVIVLLLFGTKRLKGLGGDLGGAIKGFKKAIGDDDSKDSTDDSVKQVEAEHAAEKPSDAKETQKSDAGK